MNVKSMQETTDVSGWPFYIGLLETSRYNKQGKMFFGDRRVFTGEWKGYRMVEGEMSTLQQDGSRLIAHCRYDHKKDKANEVWYDD